MLPQVAPNATVFKNLSAIMATKHAEIQTDMQPADSYSVSAHPISEETQT